MSPDVNPTSFDTNQNSSVCEEKNICENFQFFENSTYEIPKNAILMLTGPGMFTKSFREAVACNHHKGIAQTDVNFNGHGVFAMPRSEARYLRVPTYQHSRNGAIIKSL